MSDDGSNFKSQTPNLYAQRLATLKKQQLEIKAQLITPLDAVEFLIVSANQWSLVAAASNEDVDIQAASANARTCERIVDLIKDLSRGKQ